MATRRAARPHAHDEQRDYDERSSVHATAARHADERDYSGSDSGSYYSDEDDGYASDASWGSKGSHPDDATRRSARCAIAARPHWG